MPLASASGGADVATAGNGHIGLCILAELTTTGRFAETP